MRILPVVKELADSVIVTLSAVILILYSESALIVKLVEALLLISSVVKVPDVLKLPVTSTEVAVILILFVVAIATSLVESISIVLVPAILVIFPNTFKSPPLVMVKTFVGTSGVDALEGAFMV